MDNIGYAIFNECYREAREFKRGLREYYHGVLVLNYRFRACTEHVLMQSLESRKSMGILPDILLLAFPFHKAESLFIIGKMKDAYPEIKILLLTKTEDQRLINKAFFDGANGVMPADSTYENIVDACQYLMQHQYLHNTYFDLFIEHQRQNQNRPSLPAYIPDETDIKITELLRDGFIEKEIAFKLSLSDSQIKHRIEKINDAIRNEKRKSIGIVLWFIRHGYISDALVDAV
jgi:DNA-binding NarL/FixJ family response regulator